MTTCKQCGYWDAITDDGLCQMCAQERPEPANTSKNAIIHQLKDTNHMLFRQLKIERLRGQETADVLSDIADENDVLRAENEALKAAALAVIEDCEAVGVIPFHLQQLRGLLTQEPATAPS